VRVAAYLLGDEVAMEQQKIGINDEGEIFWWCSTCGNRWTRRKMPQGDGWATTLMWTSPEWIYKKIMKEITESDDDIFICRGCVVKAREYAGKNADVV
jgi:hypothetical protein